MTGNRRRSESRKDDDSNTDRRKSKDRRLEEGRRAEESSAPARPAKTPKSKKKAGKSEKKTAVKGRAGWTNFFKRVALAFMMLVACFTFSLIYFFSHLDYYMGKLGQRVSVELDRATLDPESLTDRSTRARLNLIVKNMLPLEIVLQNISFNIHLSDYTIAKGMQVMPKVVVRGYASAVVPVACNVDSIMTRRGLQKAMDTKPQPSQKATGQQISARNDKISDNLKPIIKIDGIAEFRLKAAGVEIPFTRTLALGKRN